MGKLKCQSCLPKAFTLVELIVVITILAILGTIGFLSLQGYSLSARDSERLSDMGSIARWLEMLAAKWTLYPRPDANSMNISASWTLIAYQWYAGQNVLNAISFGWKGKDPLDGQYYTYSTNPAQNKYQLLGLLENWSALAYEMPLLPVAYAWAYDSRVVSTKWSPIGIIVGTWSNLNQPVQELYSASLTGVDLVNTQTEYVMHLSSSEKFVGSGSVLKSTIAGGWLVSYWDMETSFNSGWITYLKDFSSTWNHGEWSGGIVLWGTGWKLGNATYFDGTSNWIGMRKAMLNNVDQYTMAGWIRPAAQSATMDYFYTEWTPLLTYAVHFIWNENYKIRLAAWNKNFPGNWYGTVRSAQSYEFPLNTWTHFAVAYDNWKASIYINWSLKESVTFQKQDNDNTAINGKAAFWLSIWSKYGGNQGSDHFRWSIDEFRIYNRDLSDSEILALYNATK